jgi:hypothetical protein
VAITTVPASIPIAVLGIFAELRAHRGDVVHWFVFGVTGVFGGRCVRCVCVCVNMRCVFVWCLECIWWGEV